MNENKITTYLLYAIGEIVLVVVGILVAIQIDGVYQQKKLEKDEINSYKQIIADLKKDSVMFQRLRSLGTLHLDAYYHIYDEIFERASYDENIEYGFIGITKTFNPITQMNHQNTIEKLSNDSIRNRINDYFNFQRRAEVGVRDFNAGIRNVARPYIESNGLLNHEVIFSWEKDEFLPQSKILIYEVLSEKYQDPNFVQILTHLRVSMGYFLYELDELIMENEKLIKTLNTQVN